MKLLDGVKAEAVISDCGQYRYRLTRTWGPGKLLGVVMLNPSTADAETDDQTLRKVQHYAREWGFDGAAVVNLYALRSTDPKALRTHPDPIGDLNGWYTGGGFLGENSRVAMVVAAWGVNAEAAVADKWLDTATRIFRRYVYCLGLTNHGHPRHPCRLPNDLKPQSWARGRAW